MTRDMPARDRRQQGFTLPEMMIALVLGLLLTSAIITAYSSIIHSSNNNTQQAQLNHNLRASLDLIVNELRRAGGYTIEAPADITSFANAYRNNPFATQPNNLALYNCNNAICSCVTYSYDLNNDGQVGVSSNSGAATGTDENTANVEQFGFRLNDGAIEMRMGRASISNTGFDCSNATGTWQDLTEPEVTMSSLQIRYIDANGNTQAGPTQLNVDNGVANCSSGDTCLETRQLAVTITGSRGDYSLTVSGRVRVRNDRLYVP